MNTNSLDTKKVKVLELFAGTKSIGKAAEELGYEVFSSDIELKFNTDYTVDLLEFDVSKVPWVPDIIWASPPCISFSIASVHYHWTKNKQPKSEKAITGYALVKKTLELIDYFQPTYWYIENPRGFLRKFPIMIELPIRNTVNYCVYGDTRLKPTDIWTNNPHWIPRLLCKEHDHIKYSIKENNGLNSSEIASIIPHELCLEIMLSSKF